MIQIAQEQFSTKAAAEARLKSILHSSRGKVVDAADDAFLRDAIKRHPRAIEKIGPGIKWFEVGRARSVFIALRRTDGLLVDFSYKNIFRDRSDVAKRRDKARRAMRDEIESHIAARRQELGLDSSMHIDHGVGDQAFRSLAKSFLDYQALTLETLPVGKIYDSNGLVSRYCIADKTLAERWRAFHAKRATLRPMTAQENMRQGAGR